MALRSCQGNVKQIRTPYHGVHLDYRTCGTVHAQRLPHRALLQTVPSARSHVCRAIADVETTSSTQSVLELDPVYEGEYCSKQFYHLGLGCYLSASFLQRPLEPILRSLSRAELSSLVLRSAW